MGGGTAKPREVFGSPRDDPLAAVQFTTTRWSLVFSAANPESHVAREQFARLYAYPLYAFARREGLAVPDAQDAVQGFLSRLMVGDRLGGVRPEGGRFRSYLLAGFRNFVVSQHRHDVAQSRRPEAGMVFLDGLDPEQRLALEPVTSFSPETEYDRRCALSLIESVQEEMRRDYESRGQSELFHHLLRHLTDELDSESHAEAAARLGRDPGTIRNAMVGFRSRFNRLFRERVSATLDGDDAHQVDEEIRHLHQALGS